MAEENAFVSWLEKAGTVVRNFLHIGIGLAQEVEPVVDLAVPEVASLYNTVVGLCVAAEATAVASTGTGAQKLADVVSKVGPQAAALFGSDEAKIKDYVSAVVQTLNAIPSKSAKASS